MTERSSYLWPNWLMLILGVWLFFSPWIIAAPALGAWAWNAWIVGLLLALVSIGALTALAEWEEWINLVLGGWMFFSPWIFGYTTVTGPAWNSYIVGVLTVVIAIWGIVAARQAGGTLSAQGR